MPTAAAAAPSRTWEDLQKRRETGADQGRAAASAVSEEDQAAGHASGAAGAAADCGDGEDDEEGGARNRVVRLMEAAVQARVRVQDVHPGEGTPGRQPEFAQVRVPAHGHLP